MKSIYRHDGEFSNKKISVHKIIRITLTLMVFVMASSVSGCGDDRYAFVTTPAGLVMREQAGVNHPKIAVIPYGARVRVIDADGMAATVNGIKGRWCKVSFNNREGWAFNGYLRLLKNELADKIARGGYSLKALTQEGVTSSDVGYHMRELLRFNKEGEALYTSTVNMMLNQEKTEQKGTYTIDDEGIVITLKPGKKTKSFIDPVSNKLTVESTKDVSSATINLCWSERLHAFVRKENMAMLDSPDYKVNVKESYIITREDEKDLSDMGKEIKMIGYFVER